MSKILGVKISNVSSDEVLAFVLERLANRQKFSIFTPNPEIVVAAQTNSELKKALNSTDVNLPDGAGVVWASRFLQRANKIPARNIEQVRGREVMVDLFGLADKKGLKIYILGSTPRVNKKSVARVLGDYKNIKVKGSSGPVLNEDGLPETKRDNKIETDTISEINRFMPDILFVAFGAPKQEIWVSKHLSKLKVGGAMVVGGALDTFSGEKSLPPKLLAGLGLEWLWRLLREPRRLKRILNAVVVFPFLVLMEVLDRKV